jgi:hypothetical protein
MHIGKGAAGLLFPEALSHCFLNQPYPSLSVHVQSIHPPKLLRYLYHDICHCEI